MDTVKRGLDDEHSHLDSELKCHTVNSDFSCDKSARRHGQAIYTIR